MVDVFVENFHLMLSSQFSRFASRVVLLDIFSKSKELRNRHVGNSLAHLADSLLSRSIKEMMDVACSSLRQGNGIRIIDRYIGVVTVSRLRAIDIVQIKCFMAIRDTSWHVSRERYRRRLTGRRVFWFRRADNSTNAGRHDSTEQKQLDY